MVGEKALFAARRADLNAQLAVLNQQLLQRKQQIDEIKVEIKTSIRNARALLEKQISIIEPLVKSGLSPETDLLSLLRQARDFKGKIERANTSFN